MMVQQFGRNSGHQGHGRRAHTMLNNLLNKPKKTILVKVQSNEALQSKSDLATKH